MTKLLSIFAVTLFFNLSFAQISIIDSCESRDGFCGSSFRLYSDSSFLKRFGCERHQGIRIGHYSTKLDTTYLKIVDFSFQSFIDSIVFIKDTLNTTEIDVTYICRDGKPTISEYNMLTQLDSARVWSSMDGPLNIRKRYEGIYSYSRSMDNWEKEIEFTSSHPYYYSQSFITKVDCDLGLILRDLSIWIGLDSVIEIPKDTREVIIYYGFVSDIIRDLNYFQARLKKKGTSDLIECKGRLYKFE